ncbi:MAG: glycosyltransferase [Candidatus Actinomarina sp.]|tara:strand:+ start:1733 stop:2860 length:1128 start_codon:yes stop_codon:yes gene_type:complete
MNINNNKINYITYQTFPSIKANTIQTMDNIKYFEKNGFDVELSFPLRENNSTSEKKILKNYYPISDDLIINGEDHNLPFGKISILEKYLFLISHFLWSWKISKKFNSQDSINFTRSDWIFYFLSRKDLPVVFECHQLTKIRKWILKKAIKKQNSKIIFLNSQLLIDSEINNPEQKLRLIVVPNAVDGELFRTKPNKRKGQILFLGNVERFNSDRNLKFIIDCFKIEEIKHNFNLKIVGGNNISVKNLRKYVSDNSLSQNIDVLEHVSRKEAIKYLDSSEIGLLINSHNNKHSTHHTSPLKYFEYLYGGLKVLAVDFPAHKGLPFSDNIVFYKNNDSESFKKALNKIEDTNQIDKNLLNEITLDLRTKKIIKFILT